MATDIKQQQLFLRRLGMRIPLAQVSEAMATIKSDPSFQKDLEKMNNLQTMINEDSFLEAITTSHQRIAQIPNNQSLIQTRDNAFIIRAISPEDIKSLTERAFFNSFNLERNVMNDLEEQNKLQKQTSYRAGKQPKERYGMSNENGQRNRGADAEDEEKCICGKNIPASEWVQCINEDKCRGSNWYHMQCAGFDPKDIENIKDKDFICEKCRREDDGEDESMQSSSRKRVKDEQSIKQ